jgi:hypothetical protein
MSSNSPNTADPALAPQVVEELLRYFSIADTATARTALADIQIRGATNSTSTATPARRHTPRRGCSHSCNGCAMLDRSLVSGCVVLASLLARTRSWCGEVALSWAPGILVSDCHISRHTLRI